MKRNALASLIGAESTADIRDFADCLRSIFGAAPRALASVIRATPEYRLWRARVQWCPVCCRYVPISRRPNGTATYYIHEIARARRCPNSHATVMSPAPESERTDFVRDHLLRLLGAAPSDIEQADSTGGH